MTATLPADWRPYRHFIGLGPCPAPNCTGHVQATNHALGRRWLCSRNNVGAPDNPNHVFFEQLRTEPHGDDDHRTEALREWPG